jgi:hypothetical protein
MKITILILALIGAANLYYSAQLASIEPFVAPSIPPTVPAYVENLMEKSALTQQDWEILIRYSKENEAEWNAWCAYKNF